MESITIAWRNDERETFERVEHDPLRARQLVSAIEGVENLTRIMTRAELRAWMLGRGVPERDVELYVGQNYGRTEDELDAEYDRVCGRMA